MNKIMHSNLKLTSSTKKIIYAKLVQKISSLYSIRYLTFSQCRDLRTGVMSENLGDLTTVRARVLDLLKSIYLRIW